MSDYGLGSMGATLAARILTLPPTHMLINAGLGPGTAYIWQIPPDTAPDQPYLGLYIGTAGLNFPYGVSVAPDEPL